MPITKTMQKERTFYISPAGNDAWSGRMPLPNARRTDGPFTTVQRARDAVRELKATQGGSLKQPVSVRLRKGTYYQSEPLLLTQEDSGTARCPVTWQAYGNEKVVISGGRRITGWKTTSVNGHKAWVADLPEVRAGKWCFHQLWANGARRARARHPKKGYLQIAGISEDMANAEWDKGTRSFKFSKGDLKKWSTARHAEVVAMCKWTDSHLPIANVNERTSTVTFEKQSVFKLEPGDLYYVEHALELLTEPGEWFLDRSAGRLYYIPQKGEDRKDTEVIAAALEQVLHLHGRPEAGEFVEHVHFHGLAFAHSEWYFPQDARADWLRPGVGGFAQAAVGVPGAIYCEGVRNCDFEECTIAHVGNYGLQFARGCQHNHVRRCEIFDTGAGGIKIGEISLRSSPNDRTHSNEISDCHIHSGGRIFHSGIGVWIGQSSCNRVIHNHIHDFYYSGISIGWTWGYTDSLAQGNKVEYNHVHHIGILSNGDGPILSDMGGIYTLGNQQDTLIRNNVFHDIAGLRYGGWGIYFDEGTTDIFAENNLVYRTTHGGFHQHYGKDNIVRNNIFALGRDMQATRSRSEPHVSFRFEGNIVYCTQGKIIAGNFDNLNVVFDRNLYYLAGEGEMKFGEMSFREWQAKGMDRHSIIADPLFVNPGKSDFHLRPKSPALRAGFRCFSVARVGPRAK